MSQAPKPFPPEPFILARGLSVEKLRSRLFKLTHPDRSQLEAEGRWPE